MSDTNTLGTTNPATPGTPVNIEAATNGGPGHVNTAYGADQIQVLEGLDAVRKRPGMYIGGTGLSALHHLVYEVVDNSIDEAMAGHATFVSVTVQPDGSCRVVDDGRGIPVEPMKHEDPTLNGRPAVEIVLTKLHAGGKFQQEGSAYKVSGGLHGVGVSCVNALSEYLDCEVYRDGKIHSIGFERGRVVHALKFVGPVPANTSRSRGTSVTFRPDPTIFPETSFDYATLSARLRELSFLNPGVTLTLTDERVGPDGKMRSETYQAKHGLLEYVAHLMTGKSPVSNPVYFRADNPEAATVCEIAMQYHDGYAESVLSFANNINNVDGGTHAQGFKVALTRALNGYSKKTGIIKEKDPTPTGEDLREGLVAIVSVKIPNPTFNNQPKEKLLNPEVEGFVAGAVQEGLERWLEEHPAEAKRLCLRGIIAAQAREAARKARELTRRKSALDGGSMPHKLRDCKTKNVDESELFIVEGDSAGGSATLGRNVETQAILPLKGKILNVEKARIDRMLDSDEIRTLIAALRVGIGQELDISKLRYGKIIIMTDADVDGSHI
ncbi:MAG: ATP-binding protein, partial [Phycisphaerales bacterium]